MFEHSFALGKGSVIALSNGLVDINFGRQILWSKACGEITMTQMTIGNKFRMLLREVVPSLDHISR